VTFFFDNTFSRSIPRILLELDIDATHLRDHFPADTKDVVWIPEIGKKGWVLVTADLSVQKRNAERIALREANIVTFFFGTWFLDKRKWDQVVWIIKHWRTIEEEAHKTKPGTSLEVNSKCQFIKKTV